LRTRFALVVANLLADTVVAAAPELTGLVAARGRLVLSGLRSEQTAAVRAAYPGWVPATIRTEDGWDTLTLMRAGAGCTAPALHPPAPRRGRPRADRRRRAAPPAYAPSGCGRLARRLRRPRGRASAAARARGGDRRRRRDRRHAPAGSRVPARPRPRPG